MKKLPTIIISSVRIQRVFIHVPDEPLRGFANVALQQQFVIRRIKIVQGQDGLLIYNPSVENVTHCFECDGKNPLRRRNCQWCNVLLPSEEERAGCTDGERVNRKTEQCHPVDADFRDHLKAAVLAAFRATVEADMDEAFVEMNYDRPTVRSVQVLQRSDDFEEFILRKPQPKRRRRLA